MRVVADPVNQIPVAVPTADLVGGSAPLAVVFNARDSWDPDTGIQNYEWDYRVNRGQVNLSKRQETP